MTLSTQRVAYVYRAKREIQGSKVRVIWGYVSINIRMHAPSHSNIFAAVSPAPTGTRAL